MGKTSISSETCLELRMEFMHELQVEVGMVKESVCDFLNLARYARTHIKKIPFHKSYC